MWSFVREQTERVVGTLDAEAVSCRSTAKVHVGAVLSLFSQRETFSLLQRQTESLSGTAVLLLVDNLEEDQSGWQEHVIMI